MKLLKALKETKNFSAAENAVIAYILEDPKQAVALSIRDLSDRTYTSAAVIFRLCQKLGFKGYTEFKIKFFSEMNRVETFKALIGEKPITEQDNARSIVDKIACLEIEALQETKNELDIAQLMKVADWAAKAEVLDFYSFDNNVRLAQLACAHFLQLGKLAVCNSAANAQYAQAIASTPTHVAFILSHTGENRKLIRIAKTLRDKKVKSVLLSVSADSSLARECDAFFYVASTEEYLKLGYFIYSTGVKYLLDVLFGMLMAQNYASALAIEGQFNQLMGTDPNEWRSW